MFGLFVLLVFGIIIYQAIAGARKRNLALSSFQTLTTSGIPARGLVLSSSVYTTGVTMNGVRYEKRSMVLDVEIPGRAPYVSMGDFLVPRGLVEPVPGASLDLSVDPGNPNRIVVVGPGGFSGPWLQLGPPNSY